MSRWASGWPRQNKPRVHLRKKYSKNEQDRTGTTLIEVVVSSLLVAILLVTTLQSTLLIHSSTSQIDRQTAWRLAADGLIEELRGLHYAEPDGATELGCDDGESITNRESWDDCDDANGFRTNKLTNRDGTMLSTTPIFASISVEYVSPADLSKSTTDLGLKRATVTIGNDGESISVQSLFTMMPNSFQASHGGIQANIKFTDKSTLSFTVAPRNRIEAK